MTIPRAVAVLVVVAVAAGACSRGESLGRDEAVEILVLDGLPRVEAECLVREVADELSLAEVTGLDGDLDREELRVLFEASGRCSSFAAPSGGGTVGGPGDALDDLGFIEELELGDQIDVEGVVAELLRGGFDAELAVCVATVLLGGTDPAVAVTDETRQLDAIVACESG